jgi:hypothetical protein
MIYFIEEPQSRCVKIGYSIDPLSRLATIQTGFPVELKLLGVLRGSRNAEQRLHQKFSEHRLNGEWFRGEPIRAYLSAVDLQQPKRRAYSALALKRSRSSRLKAVLTALGGVGQAARILGTTKQAVSQWDEVPPRRVLQVEKITGLSRHQIRPDIYGKQP